MTGLHSVGGLREVADILLFVLVYLFQGVWERLRLWAKGLRKGLQLKVGEISKYFGVIV